MHICKKNGGKRSQSKHNNTRINANGIEKFDFVIVITIVRVTAKLEENVIIILKLRIMIVVQNIVIVVVAAVTTGGFIGETVQCSFFWALLMMITVQLSF